MSSATIYRDKRRILSRAAFPPRKNRVPSYTPHPCLIKELPRPFLLRNTKPSPSVTPDSHPHKD